MSRHDNAITTREFWDAHAATAALSADEPPDTDTCDGVAQLRGSEP